MSLIHNITRWLISKKESPKVNRQFVSWKNLSRVAIIAYDNQLSELADFIAACQKDQIRVKVYIIYKGKPELAPKPPFEYQILDKKQFGLLHLPKDPAIQSLQADSYDLLVNLGKEEQLDSLAISKVMKASCKTSAFENPVFDLMLDVPDQGAHQFLKQLVVYLNMIKTA